MEVLALSGDSSIAEWDPLSPMSSSRISVPVQRLQVENYIAAAKGTRKAFSPLGSDGQWASELGKVFLDSVLN